MARSILRYVLVLSLLLGSLGVCCTTDRAGGGAEVSELGVGPRVPEGNRNPTGFGGSLNERKTTKEVKHGVYALSSSNTETSWKTRMAPSIVSTDGRLLHHVVFSRYLNMGIQRITSFAPPKWFEKTEQFWNDTPAPGIFVKFRNVTDEYGERLLHLIASDIASGPVVTRGWPLTRASDAALVLVAYLLGMLVLGVFFACFYAVIRKYKLQKTEELVHWVVKKPQIVYNILQIVLCGYMVWRTMVVVKKDNMKIACNAYDPMSPRVADVLWVFYMTKILDFCDTLFIVLRGKWQQLSFLHLYHHVTTFVLYWINTRIACDGDIYFTVLLNSGIHCIMYLYYLVTAYGFRVSKQAKALVTYAQMAQFVAMNLHGLWVLSFRYGQNSVPEVCPFPHRVVIIYLVYIGSLLLLFNSFRKREYVASDDRKGTETTRKRFEPANLGYSKLNNQGYSKVKAV